MTDPRITVFGAVNADGGRNVGVHGADGARRALIQSAGPEDDARCLAVATMVADADAAVDAHLAVVRSLERENADLRRKLENVSRQRDVARELHASAISGHRRFSGPVLCKPALPGKWGGDVWLLDPIAQERGFGLRFDSLADVRRAHPELWIVDVRDGGILLDAFPLAAAVRS